MKAVYASKDPVQILQNVSKSCVRAVIGSYDVDSVLTTGKNEIQSKVRDMIISQLDKHDVGLQVVNVTIQDSEPPTAEVMEAFKAVETAKQGKETAINNANKYRNEKLPGPRLRLTRSCRMLRRRRPEGSMRLMVRWLSLTPCMRSM